MNLLTHSFETSKCRLLAVNLPEDAKWIQISEKTICWVDDYAKEFILPPGDWEILNVTEEKAREVVDETEYYDPYAQPYPIPAYKNYLGDEWFWNALESFESLLKSEIKTVNKYGEKPAHFELWDKYGDKNNYGACTIWLEEQATVFDNYIILISKK